MTDGREGPAAGLSQGEEGHFQDSCNSATHWDRLPAVPSAASLVGGGGWGWVGTNRPLKTKEEKMQRLRGGAKRVSTGCLSVALSPGPARAAC